MGKFVPPNKINWTKEMDEFLIKNYQYMTNPALAAALKLKLTSVRTRLYQLGYKRMKLQYWTEEQIQFLKENYKEIGDTELAEIFNQRWEKEKGWTKKHIEKKRRYLKLKRTKIDQQLIQDRNTADGRFSVNHWKRWDKLTSPIGKVVIWHDLNGYTRPYIKTSTGYVTLARYMFSYHNGSIPTGMNVVHLDGNPLNCKRENLKMISDEEIGPFTGAPTRLTDNYVAAMLSYKQPELREYIRQRPDLIELKRAQLQLDRKIRTHEQQNAKRT